MSDMANQLHEIAYAIGKLVFPVWMLAIAYVLK